MQLDERASRLKGIFSIVVTPFHKDGAFDFAGLAENIERVISVGYDGLLIGGTYGEFPVMTTQERAEVRSLGSTVPARSRSAPNPPEPIPVQPATAAVTALTSHQVQPSLTQTSPLAACIPTTSSAEPCASTTPVPRKHSPPSSPATSTHSSISPKVFSASPTRAWSRRSVVCLSNAGMIRAPLPSLPLAEPARSMPALLLNPSAFVA